MNASQHEWAHVVPDGQSPCPPGQGVTSLQNRASWQKHRVVLPTTWEQKQPNGPVSPHGPWSKHMSPVHAGQSSPEGGDAANAGVFMVATIGVAHAIAVPAPIRFSTVRLESS